VWKIFQFLFLVAKGTFKVCGILDFKVIFFSGQFWFSWKLPCICLIYSKHFRSVLLVAIRIFKYLVIVKGNLNFMEIFVIVMESLDFEAIFRNLWH
jgi:hypothetical protein